jgi:hypothetical protein
MQQQVASLDRQVVLDFVKTVGLSFAVGLGCSLAMVLLVLALVGNTPAG